MREIDIKLQLKAVVGVKARPFKALAFAFTHFHGLLDADKFLGSVLQLNASTLQQEHERGRRSVQNRHFFGGDIYVQVINTQAVQGRHQVLDGVHLGIAHTNGGRHARVHNRLGMDGHIHRLWQVHATKHNARIRLRRAQCHLDTLAAVQAHAHGTGDGLDGTLLKHGVILLVRGCLLPLEGLGNIYNADC